MSERDETLAGAGRAAFIGAMIALLWPIPAIFVLSLVEQCRVMREAYEQSR